MVLCLMIQFADHGHESAGWNALNDEEKGMYRRKWIPPSLKGKGMEDTQIYMSSAEQDQAEQRQQLEGELAEGVYFFFILLAVE